MKVDSKELEELLKEQREACARKLDSIGLHAIADLIRAVPLVR